MITTLDMTNPTMSDDELTQLAVNYLDQIPLGSFNEDRTARAAYGERKTCGTMALIAPINPAIDIHIPIKVHANRTAIDDAVGRVGKAWRDSASRIHKYSSDVDVYQLQSGSKYIFNIPTDILAIKLDRTINNPSEAGPLRLLEAFKNAIEAKALTDVEFANALRRACPNHTNFDESAEVDFVIRFADTHMNGGRSLKVTRHFYKGVRAAADLAAEISRNDALPNGEVLSGHVRFGGLAVGDGYNKKLKDGTISPILTIPIRLYLVARLDRDTQLKAPTRAAAGAAGTQAAAGAAARARTEVPTLSREDRIAAAKALLARAQAAASTTSV